MTEDEKKELARQEEINETYWRRSRAVPRVHRALGEVLDKKELKDPNTGKQLASDKDDKIVAEQAKAFKLENLDIRSRTARRRPTRSTTGTGSGSSSSSTSRSGSSTRSSRGDELPSGVQQMVKVYVATKRSSPSATRWPAGTATRASSPRCASRRTCRS